MPLPFGHSLMGYALYETIPAGKERPNWRMVLLFALVANLPDIDFLPGLLLGNPNKFHHHYFCHSLGFAVIVGSIVGFWVSVTRRKRFLPYFLIFATVCFSHVVLDAFTVDTREPLGVPMFWPLSSNYFYSPVSIFMSVHKLSSSNSDFVQSLFVMHNLWVALWEVAIFLPVLTLVAVLKKRRPLVTTANTFES